MEWFTLHWDRKALEQIIFHSRMYRIYLHYLLSYKYKYLKLVIRLQLKVIWSWVNREVLRAVTQALRAGSSIALLVTRSGRYRATSALSFKTASVPARLIHVFESQPELRQACISGRALYGCIESFLLWRLTATADPSCARSFPSCRSLSDRRWTQFDEQMWCRRFSMKWTQSAGAVARRTRDGLLVRERHAAVRPVRHAVERRDRQVVRRPEANRPRMPRHCVRTQNCTVQ